MSIGHYPDYISNIEATIIDLIIDSALFDGGSISVYDCEEWALVKSKSKAEIQAEVCATDETTFRFYSKNGDRVGWVWLIHGNLQDVISDYSDNAATGNILERANKYAEDC